MREKTLKSTNGNGPDDIFIILDRDFDEDPYGHLRGKAGNTDAATATIPKPQPL